MHIPQVLKRLNRLEATGHSVQLAPPASEEAISETQVRLGLSFPEPVSRYWKAFDGLVVIDPQLEILPLAKFKLVSGLLFFSTLNRHIELAFRTDCLNVAGQWSILIVGTNEQLTFTLQSFWSIHIWHWLERRRTIWIGPPY